MVIPDDYSVLCLGNGEALAGGGDGEDGEGLGFV